MRYIFNFKVWLFFSVVWVAAMAFWCIQHWPRLPLDVSSLDPETLQILKNAQWRHLAEHAAAALVPPAIAYGVGRMICAALSRKS